MTSVPTVPVSLVCRPKDFLKRAVKIAIEETTGAEAKQRRLQDV